MKTKVWIVDDDSSIRFVLEKALSHEGFLCTSFSEAESLLDSIKISIPDIIISDIRMPGMDGLEMLKEVHKIDANIPVIITTAHSDLTSAVNSYKSGSFEYLPKPFDIDEAIAIVKKAETQHFESRIIRNNINNDTRSPEIIGESVAMQEVFRAIGRLSRSSISVLINGESGTGKELVAHALHKHSERNNKPFIALNMAAIPKELIESELFGHDKGAFTGANVSRQGRFEQANGGTLFLDEIGDMPLEVQTRLLRVLSNGEFYRVGGHQSISVDVRIIAATHQNLEKLVSEGKFREDLFYRLNVIRIHIPALRKRPEDIPQLANKFLSVASKELNIEPKILSSETIEYFKQLPWPGNVRQLQNVCKWLTVMASGQEVSVSDLPIELQNINENVKVIDKEKTITETVSDNTELTWEILLKKYADDYFKKGGDGLLDILTPKYEKILLTSALIYTHDHKQEAAKLLGWGRNTLTRKLKELGID
ncbi:MAG: nitrogen regulation protein NR(I) [Succinivibrionaceae bacterium]